jgi:hypothetical protein
MKKVDLMKLDVAIKYVERIADGYNPVNNVPMGNSDILNNPNIIRCMYFIKDVLEEVRSNDGIIGGKKEKPVAAPFPIEVLDEFQYKEDQSITHVLHQIYEPVEGLNVKKISATKVTAVLKEEGYLLDERNSGTGKTRKVPSVKGEELGIYVVEREYNGRMYQVVTYNQNAQEYIVEILKKMIEEK